MNIVAIWREGFVVEFDQEMAATRRVLERVPQASLAWKPHDLSFSLGALATHLAQLPHWGTRILERDMYDLASATGEHPALPSLTETVTLFDRHVDEVRRAFDARADAELAAPWTLKRGDHTILSMPRLSALRRFLLHHVIHHRGQLTVYLRLQGVPLPPLYGPTADERM